MPYTLFMLHTSLTTERPQEAITPLTPLTSKRKTSKRKTSKRKTPKRKTSLI